MPDESTEENEKKSPKFMLIKRFQVGDDVSLVNKAANGETFLAVKSEDGNVSDDGETDEEITASKEEHGGAMDEKGMLRKMFA